MKYKKRVGAFAIAVLALALLLSLMMPLAATVEAAPHGARELPEYELEDIWIYDADGKPLKISIEDVADAHGELCICVACAFRVTQAAVAELWDLEEEYPRQGELEVTYHHPSQGHKDAFEYLLTEGCCTLEMPEGTRIDHLTMENYAYTFTRMDTGDTLDVQVNEGVFPEGFFALREKVKSGEATDDEKAQFASQWSDARDNFLLTEAWELFEGVEEPGEEPFPSVGVGFTGALLLLIIVAFVYSWRGRRR